MISLGNRHEKDLSMKDVVIALIVATSVASLVALRYEQDGRSGSGRLVLRWEETHIALGALAGIASLLMARRSRA